MNEKDDFEILYDKCKKEAEDSVTSLLENSIWDYDNKQVILKTDDNYESDRRLITFKSLKDLYFELLSSAELAFYSEMLCVDGKYLYEFEYIIVDKILEDKYLNHIEKLGWDFSIL